MAKSSLSSSRRIPKARRVRRTAQNRFDVTRAEYNYIVDVLNERNLILNAFREAIAELVHTTEVQFKRIAQLQAELDQVRRAWEHQKASS